MHERLSSCYQALKTCSGPWSGSSSVGRVSLPDRERRGMITGTVATATMHMLIIQRATIQPVALGTVWIHGVPAAAAVRV